MIASRLRPWHVLLPALGLFVVLASRFGGHTVDDAFITFRYAKNLAAGLGPVYNAGERVEGYTNFLWMLILAAGAKLHFEPETLSLGLGLLFGALTIVAAARFAWRGPASAWSVWIAPMFLAVHPAMAVWAPGGLEAPLFACLVTWGVGLAAFDAEGGSLRRRSAVLLALAALTRPEGALVAALVAALALAPGAGPRPRLRNVVTWGLVFLAIWAPYFAWRWSYYGYLLPNTFYAKVDVHGAAVARGLAQLHSFAKVTGYWLLLPIAGLALARPRRSVLIVAGVTAAYIVYIVYVGGDGLPMYRFFVPVLAPLFLLVGWGFEGWRRRFAVSPAIAAVASVAFAVALAATARFNFSGPGYEYVEQDTREVATWSEIGRWFRRNAARGDSLAVFPAGAMPYYSGLRTIDMLGLNDVTIAHTRVALGQGQAGHEKTNVDYVMGRAPTYVVVGAYELSLRETEPLRMVRPYYAFERALLASEAFNAGYRPEAAQTESGGWFTYFRRIER